MPLLVLLTLASGELARLSFGDPVEPDSLPEPERLLWILDDYPNRRDEIWDLNLGTISGGTYSVLSSDAPGARLIPAILARGATTMLDQMQLVRGFLNHPDPNVRLAAMKAIGQTSDSESLPLLLPLLGENDLRFKLAAVSALGGIGDPQLPPQIEAAALGDPRLSEAAHLAIQRIEALISKDPNRIVDAYVESPESDDLLFAAGMLRDELIRVVVDRGRSVTARRNAARLLAVRGGPSPPRRLARILDDPEEPMDLRIQVAEGFGRFRFKPGVPILLRVLDGDLVPLQSAAIAALGRTGAVQAIEPLLLRWSAHDGRFQQEILLALWRLFPLSGRDVLERSLRSGEATGIESIHAIEDGVSYRQFQPQLIRSRLPGTSTQAKFEAILLLAQVGGAEDVSALRQLAETDADATIREFAGLAATRLAAPLQ